MKLQLYSSEPDEATIKDVLAEIGQQQKECDTRVEKWLDKTLQIVEKMRGQ